jgi:alpha-L-rhamnosidase
VQPIVDHYDSMKKWMEYMRKNYLVNGIMTKDTYGDWCMPPESLELIHSQDPTRRTAGPVLSTAFYYDLLRRMARFAPLAGHPEDAAVFEAQAAESLKAFNKAYFKADAGCYDNNTVTANLLALHFGMVPQGREQDVFKHVVEKTEVDCGGHVSTGVIGIMFLMRTLTEYGRPDLALKIASNDTYPSWGYMARNGATTIWELWNGNTADPAMNSGNHVMLLGDLIIWEYEYLGGIRPLEPGYKAVAFKPYPIKGLDWVNCSYDSVSGKIVSNWKVDGGKFEWDVEIPEGVKANVYIPAADGSRQMKEVGPGSHHFSADYNL